MNKVVLKTDLEFWNEFIRTGGFIHDGITWARENAKDYWYYIAKCNGQTVLTTYQLENLFLYKPNPDLAFEFYFVNPDEAMMFKLIWS